VATRAGKGRMMWNDPVRLIRLAIALTLISIVNIFTSLLIVAGRL
jgi:hypothetical protein